MCFFVCFVFQTLVLWYMNSSQMEIFGSSCSFKNTSKRWLFFFFIALLPLFHDVFHMCRTQWKNRTTFLIQVSVFDAKDVMGAIWLLSFSVKEGCSTQKWWLSYVSFSDKRQLKLLRTKLPFSLPYTHTSLHFNATSLYVLLSPVIFCKWLGAWTNPSGSPQHCRIIPDNTPGKTPCGISCLCCLDDRQLASAFSWEVTASSGTAPELGCW